VLAAAATLIARQTARKRSWPWLFVAAPA